MSDINSAPVLAHSDLIPPTELLQRDGSVTPQQFVAVGDGVVSDMLVRRALLTPRDRVLDIGCGSGQLARSLVDVLSNGGGYEGLDIDHATIDWLREHYADYPNFTFRHIDVYNKMYNPAGSTMPRDLVLPYADSSFDMVVLKSVFTHMLPEDVRHYLEEIARVLRPRGRAVISYFLLNEPTLALLPTATGPLVPRNIWDEDPGCMVANLQVPEAAVAHDELRVRKWYADLGLTVVDITFGDWPGRPAWRGLQDVVIAMR